MGDEPLWNAFVTALRIRVGIGDGSIVALSMTCTTATVPIVVSYGRAEAAQD